MPCKEPACLGWAGLGWAGGHLSADKSNLSKFKIEIISSIFSDHSAMKLDINYKKKTLRNTNTWRLNNTFLNNQQFIEENKRNIKMFLETNYSGNTTEVTQHACTRQR